MRLLHTADWHLGQRFHDQRRAADEEHALDQVVKLAREREVDAVLVAGDVFDNANPGAEEQRRYYRALSRLVREAGVGSVVVIAGNHDSALRLDGPRDLLRDLGIHVVGRWPRDAPAARCLVPLVDRAGETRAVCAAVPYLRDADLRLPEIGESARELHERYAAALAERYRDARWAARDAHPDQPIVVMGHAFADGGEMGGLERPVQVGNLGQVDAFALAGAHGDEDAAAYVALGHLHRPQSLPSRAECRYSGSLLPTGFDELEAAREVVLVDLAENPADPAIITRVPLAPYRRYERLEGGPDELEAAIDELPERAEDSDDDALPGRPWCEARVRLDGPRPGLARELVDRARERGWNLVSVRRVVDRASDDAASGAPASASPRELKELDPEEVFREMHRSVYGGPPDDELTLEFRRLLENTLETTEA